LASGVIVLDAVAARTIEVGAESVSDSRIVLEDPQHGTVDLGRVPQGLGHPRWLQTPVGDDLLIRCARIGRIDALVGFPQLVADVAVLVRVDATDPRSPESECNQRILQADEASG
jgi:hypothetical protein